MTELYYECPACKEALAALALLEDKIHNNHTELIELVPEAPEAERRRKVSPKRLRVQCGHCENARALLTASGEQLLGVLAAAAQRKKLDPIPF